MIKRTIECAVCRAQEVEPSEGAGWSGWGSLNGIVLDGESNPHLCPVCLAKVAGFIDEVKHGVD